MLQVRGRIGICLHRAPHPNPLSTRWQLPLPEQGWEKGRPFGLLGFIAAGKEQNQKTMRLSKGKPLTPSVSAPCLKSHCLDGINIRCLSVISIYWLYIIYML